MLQSGALCVISVDTVRKSDTASLEEDANCETLNFLALRIFPVLCLMWFTESPGIAFNLSGLLAFKCIFLQCYTLQLTCLQLFSPLFDCFAMIFLVALHVHQCNVSVSSEFGSILTLRHSQLKYKYLKGHSGPPISNLTFLE